jgi:hypothetical protein
VFDGVAATTRRLAIAAVLAAVSVLALAPHAGAADVYRYHVTIKPATNTGVAEGGVAVWGLDKLKTTTIRLRIGGVWQPATNFVAGVATHSVAAGAIATADQVQVEQPTGTVIETYTVPPAVLTGAVGSDSLIGQAPDSANTVINMIGTCPGAENDDIPVQPQGGSFSARAPLPLRPGDRLSMVVYPGKGDRIVFEDALPGETPCFVVDAFDSPVPYGMAPVANPYHVEATGLRKLVATGARIVLRRGATVIADRSEPSATNSIGENFATPPQAGDVLELYRPHTATTPAAAFTVPAIRAIHDPGASLIAIDAPAAGSIHGLAWSLYAMFAAERMAFNTPAGRTMLDFGVDSGPSRAVPLTGVDVVSAVWSSQDRRNEVTVGSAPGDLVAPTVGVRLARRWRASGRTRFFAATLTVSEVATARVALTLPAKLVTAASKPRRLLDARVALRAGVNRLRLKLSARGRTLLRRLGRRRFPAQTATFTVTATDPSGNATTTARTMKLVPR